MLLHRSKTHTQIHIYFVLFGMCVRFFPPIGFCVFTFSDDLPNELRFFNVGF